MTWDEEFECDRAAIVIAFLGGELSFREATRRLELMGLDESEAIVELNTASVSSAA